MPKNNSASLFLVVSQVEFFICCVEYLREGVRAGGGKSVLKDAKRSPTGFISSIWA